MPCTYTGSIEGDRALASREALTEVTDMLCSVLTEIDKHNEQSIRDPNYACIVTIPMNVTVFWREHKKLDRKRKQEEAKAKEVLKRKVLAKLSKEELEALGIE